MHGVSFKKRAPRAIKEIRAFAVKAMVSTSSPRASLPHPHITAKECLYLRILRVISGHQRRPPRPPTQQKSMGGRCQGRALSVKSSDIAEAK